MGEPLELTPNQPAHRGRARVCLERSSPHRPPSNQGDPHVCHHREVMVTTAVRPFTVPVTTDAELQALRARVAATRCPTEARHGPFAGGAAGGDHRTRALLGHGLRLAQVRGETERPAALYDRDRRAGHPLHPRPLRTPQRAADPHDPRVAQLVIELLAVIDPLTNPTAHGGTAADAFDVVIPSMPGYGYSGKPQEAGWGPDRIARAWTELMRRLGYTRFVAQGGDWGAIVTDVMAVQAPPELIGMHTNMAGVVPADVSTTLARNVLGPAARRHRACRPTRKHLRAAELLLHHGPRLRDRDDHPAADALRARGLPVALAAWMINHDASSYADIAAPSPGTPSAT